MPLSFPLSPGKTITLELDGKAFQTEMVPLLTRKVPEHLSLYVAENGAFQSARLPASPVAVGGALWSLSATSPTIVSYLNDAVQILMARSDATSDTLLCKILFQSTSLYDYSLQFDSPIQEYAASGESVCVLLSSGTGAVLAVLSRSGLLDYDASGPVPYTEVQPPDGVSPVKIAGRRTHYKDGWAQAAIQDPPLMGEFYVLAKDGKFFVVTEDMLEWSEFDSIDPGCEQLLASHDAVLCRKGSDVTLEAVRFLITAVLDDRSHVFQLSAEDGLFLGTVTTKDLESPLESFSQSWKNVLA